MTDQASKHPLLITAKQARFRFVDDGYVQSLIAVNEAILAAAPNSHTVTLDIPTGKREGQLCLAAHVARTLQEVGFEVNTIHDPENGSSELTIDWNHVVGEG